MNFGSHAYIIATVLDSGFHMKWLDIDVTGSSSEKEELHTSFFYVVYYNMQY